MALVAAASAWGRHVDPNMASKLGFCVPFNATDNDLEGEALAANHTLLAVDETRAARGDEREIARFLVGLAMRWELGFGKGRQTADAGARPRCRSCGGALARSPCSQGASCLR